MMRGLVSATYAPDPDLERRCRADDLRGFGLVFGGGPGCHSYLRIHSVGPPVRASSSGLRATDEHILWRRTPGPGLPPPSGSITGIDSSATDGTGVEGAERGY